MVQAAVDSNFKLPPNNNGNPSIDGEAISWSQLSDTECEEKIRSFMEDSDFIAFEKDLPPWHVLDRIEGLRWFTVLREPQARAFSNFKFMLRKNGHINQLSLGFPAVLDHNEFGLTNNFMTRLVATGGRNVDLTDEHLELAIRRLMTFEEVAILEMGNLPEVLTRLGFRAEKIRHKKNSSKFVSGYSFPQNADFFRKNFLDCALYSYFLHSRPR